MIDKHKLSIVTSRAMREFCRHRALPGCCEMSVRENYLIAAMGLGCSLEAAQRQWWALVDLCDLLDDC